MRGDRSRRWHVAAGLLQCMPVVLALSWKAAADTAWTYRADAWSVSLYIGEQGDGWCSWTTMSSDVSSGLGRSVSVQMRGGEAILLLFVEDARPEDMSRGSELTLLIDGFPKPILTDMVRSLPNGFLMARGVLSIDVEERRSLVTRLSAASSLELVVPSGIWSLPVVGLARTGSAVGRCMAEMDATRLPR